MQGLKLRLAPIMWRFFENTMRLDTCPIENIDPSKPVIYASLHRDLLPAIMYLKPTKLAVVVSNSPDGDILVKTLGRRDYRFVRGATGGDGRRALVLLRRELDAGHSVGLAVDGPEGPFGSIREGVLHLARMTGAPVAPLVARASRPVVLNTWDRTIVPVPFRKVEMEIGPILRITQEAGEPDMKKYLAISLILCIIGC